jgi:3-isopropylmalate dehydrogenase
VKRFTVAVLPGDGIGPEVTAEAVRVLRSAGDLFGYEFDTAEYPIGAVGVDIAGDSLPQSTRDAVVDADAVLLGAVGHPSLAGAEGKRRPEAGLLALRKLLKAYANLRPVTVHPALSHASPLRADRLEGVDLLIVRELLGGLYYGEPRRLGATDAVNTLRYTVPEIERVARVAFEAARGRRKLLTSVDKANVLEVSQLWRETVTRVGKEYADVRLEHLYVDFAAMRLVANPAAIDVLLTENLFGDILSDEAAVLTGSLGLLPSGSIGDGPGLFEPVHGSAPDIAGKGIANPIGAINSAAMLLRHGLDLSEAAAVVEQAVSGVLTAGARTPDIARPGEATVGTTALGEQVAARVRSSGDSPHLAGSSPTAVPHHQNQNELHATPRSSPPATSLG